MYVIVAGGGKVGYYLTRKLVDEGHEVLLLEKDARRAQELCDDLGEVAQQGDGCEMRTMEEVGMGRAQVVVAATGDDEDNLVICQLAKQRFNVPLTIARVNDPKHEEIFRSLGVDHTISGTRLIFSLIDQQVETGHIIPLSVLREGGIEVVEVDLPAGAPAAGREVKDILLPRDCVLAAIIRGGRILVPSGTTELAAGDTIIGLTRSEEEPALKHALLGPSG
jgi:trk system potassium uptake protein TrkA